MSLKNMALDFSPYAMMRKNRGLHNDLQDEYYNVFGTLMLNYSKPDLILMKEPVNYRNSWVHI